MTAGLARVVGLGAVTPVGLSAPATFAALRAGVARISEIGSFAVAGPGTESAPLRGGRVPLELFEAKPAGEVTEYPGHRAFGMAQPSPLASYLEDGPDRLVRMLAPALDEALADAEWTGTEPVDLWLALDPDDANEETVMALRAACAEVFAGHGVVLRDVAVRAEGRAAAIASMESAAQGIGRATARRAVVAGVGSLIRPRPAAQLEATGNLRSEARPLGLHPGECAAVVAVERLAERAGYRRTVVASTALEHEPTVRGEPSDGGALSRALSTALERAGGADPRPLVLCDLNGDRYRGLEWSIAFVRALGATHGGGDVWHPAEAVGDAGAGLGALVLAWAAHALEHGQAGTKRVLTWGASDIALRGACVLSTDGSERE